MTSMISQKVIEMERIDTGSEVHSSSIHEDLKTRTLYEMATAWAEQPWDGVQYKRIAEELWDSIDDLNLIEGPFGDSITLLESCIVDSNEAIEAGLLGEKQALDSLRELLENDDFFVGARIIEVSVETNPVCRISNIDILLQKDWPIGPQKPQWWKRSVRSFWLSVGVVSFATMVIIYSILISLGILPPIHLFLGVAVGIPMYALSYYFRTVATKRTWRVVFILLGSCFIGFWFILAPLTILLSYLSISLPWWLGWPLPMILSLVVGAFIGDWLGKRRDYRPYM
ncbi:MAG: hypothetical protein ThorAB25_28310 [Candidatus Thorarchaeota archaeon AB_25]|nr:MAG: hypothetical protein ThorAB25_28310 [Candidatus Thorarchaeota archaeon AB_25]